MSLPPPQQRERHWEQVLIRESWNLRLSTGLACGRKLETPKTRYNGGIETPIHPLRWALHLRTFDCSADLLPNYPMSDILGTCLGLVALVQIPSNQGLFKALKMPKKAPKKHPKSSKTSKKQKKLEKSNPGRKCLKPAISVSWTFGTHFGTQFFVFF